jgi:uncharacterized membrane protein
VATTSSRRRSQNPAERSAKSRRSPGAGRATPKTKQTAKSTAEKTKHAAKSTALVAKASPAPSKMLRKVAIKAAKRMTRKTLQSGAEVVHRAAEATADSGLSAINVKSLSVKSLRRLPIQCGVDVGVPVRVAWEEWMALTFLPEGVHRVEQIERDGDTRLLGRIAGPRGADWEAEILDERDRQSFAWQSTKGSDCAGLITFHELSERLTRILLNLDVVPTGVAEALSLSSHLADRHAEADLRRFKERVEIINPDLYENDERDEDENESEGPDGGE